MMNNVSAGHFFCRFVHFVVVYARWEDCRVRCDVLAGTITFCSVSQAVLVRIVRSLLHTVDVSLGYMSTKFPHC